MIKQLLNSVIAKYHDLSVSRRSIICLSLWLQLIIIDLLTTDKSQYFAQPRPIIVSYLHNRFLIYKGHVVVTILDAPLKHPLVQLTPHVYPLVHQFVSMLQVLLGRGGEDLVSSVGEGWESLLWEWKLLTLQMERDFF